LLYFAWFALSCIYFVYFPVQFCVSVSVKLLAVKAASKMTRIVPSGALINSTSTPTELVYGETEEGRVL